MAIYFLLGVGFETEFLCVSPDCRGTHSVDPADLELRTLPALASCMLELKACTPTPGCGNLFDSQIDIKLSHESHQKQ